MTNYIDAIKSFTAGGMLGGTVLNSITPKKRDNFEDKQLSSGMTAFVIILVIAIFIAYIVLCVAVYRLTNSGLHLVLFILFGFLYLWIALIYYGFSGHKFVKVK